MVEKLISACGLVCTDCPFYNNGCTGCFNVKGKPFWTADATKDGICPLYACSIVKKENKHCGECKKFPCKKHYNLKDPSITEEQHLESIKQRVKILTPDKKEK